MYEKYVYQEVVKQCQLKKWTIGKLAEKCYMTPQNLRLKLQGLRHMCLDDAFVIQQALNCGLTIDVLFKRS